MHIRTMNYMQEVNEKLAAIYDEHLKKTQELVAEELKRSFKNGIATGRNKKNGEEAGSEEGGEKE